MYLEVCGAAGEVTGSCYLLQVGCTRFLVDCGMHQGGAAQERENFAPFSFDPRELAFVLLTHAHIDHSGLVPRLVAQGFKGPVYATPATRDLAEIMLLDSAYIQESEAEWRNRKAQRAGRRGVEPLYTQAQAEKAVRLLEAIDYGTAEELAAGVTVVFHDAGHILGSAFVELRLSEEGKNVKVLFSGDIGQTDQPIVRDPTIIEEADYLIMESTYGDRSHVRNGSPEEELAAIMEEAKRTGGNVVIPAFAVGRTQEIIFYMRKIEDEHDFDMPIFVDSPLASKATEVFRRHKEAYDEESWALVNEPGGIFDFPEVHYTADLTESKALNRQEGAVIISASGMADAGRIRHHLKHNLWRPESHVVLVGFQARGSLGRRLLEGVERVRLFGEDIVVRAHIHEITSLSAHADQGQLLRWASHFKKPRLVLLTHGEPQAASTLRDLLQEELGFEAVVPERHAWFDLEG